jgi:hypothetical protein
LSNVRGICDDTHGYIGGDPHYNDEEGSRVYLTYQDSNEKPKSKPVDTKSVNEAELCRKIQEASRLTAEQKSRLFDMLVQYMEHFTARPSKCNLFEYEFEVTQGEPLVGHSRPIPFSMRKAVCKQI